MKKIFSILCTLVLAVSMLPQTALAKAKYEASDKAELVYALGITDVVEGKSVTLKSYLKMMSKIYQKGDLDPMDFGRMMNMLDGSEKESANISVADAIKYAVITMGYRVPAESAGGDENAYAKIAQDLDIADGISPTSRKNIGYAEAVNIIYNMLDAKPMVQKFITGTDSIYEVLNNETMLSYKLDVEKIEAVVTAVPLTSTYKADGTGDGKIELDMQEYLVADGCDFSEFLGKKVEAYTKEDKNGDTCVLFMIADKNNELVIDTDHIADVNTAGGYISYRNEQKTAVKKAKLSYPIKVIYNDRFYSEWEDGDLIPEIGQIRLLDNDNDNKYDVIFVDSYKEMVVESRAMKDKTIVSKTQYEGALLSITLDGTIDREYKIIKGEKEIAFGEISVGNSALVKESRDNKAVMIYVSDTSIEGELSSIEEAESIAVIDGTEYDLTAGLMKHMKKKAGENEKWWKSGTKYRFLVDAFGKLCYMEEIQEMNYYLYFKSYMDEGDSDNAVIVYMNMSNEWQTAQTAKKVSFEDGKCSGDVLLEHLSGKKPQLVKMEFNGKGEVKSLELAQDTDLFKDGVFTRTSQISGWYYSAQRTIDYKFYANSGAQVLKMPVGDEMYDKTLYKFEPVDSNFKNDQRAICRAFDIDEFNFSSMFTMELSNDSLSSSLSSDYFLVTKKNATIYDDEEAVELVGMLGRFSNFSYIVKDVTLAENVKKGDLLRYHVNEKGYIDYLTIEYSLEGTFSGKWNLPNGSAKLIAGTIELIDLDKGIMKINCGGGTYTLMLVGTNTVMMYEQGSGDVRIGGLSELTQGSRVVINGNWHKIATMYGIE